MLNKNLIQNPNDKVTTESCYLFIYKLIVLASLLRARRATLPLAFFLAPKCVQTWLHDFRTSPVQVDVIRSGIRTSNGIPSASGTVVSSL